MTKIEKDEIREMVRTVLQEVLGGEWIWPQCHVEKEKIEAMGKALASATAILTGGDHPENGLVTKAIRNRDDIDTIKKNLETRGNREWGVWVALILMIATTIWNTVFR